ncbi:MAG TPA: hypothetical protein VJT71_13660 [Pyrinomonadaceae bacterium]|nr:hypothetical protein [Pyrinomonadaceae bacterium]
MAELIYPTNEILYGPWLIDREGLEAFDEMLDQEWERINAYNDKKKEQEFEKRVQERIERYESEERDIDIETARQQEKRFSEEYSFLRSAYSSRSTRKINIQLKGKRIQANSFKEAFRDPELLGEVPRKFDARVECGEIDCTVILTGNLLSLRTSPEDNREARELFVSLKQWVAGIAPPKWLHLWRRFNGLQWLLWFLTILVVVLTMGRDPKDEARKTYQRQAHEILNSGMSQEQQTKAIEVLLALQSEYVPSAQPNRTPGWFVFLSFGGLVMCAISTIVPSAVLGIGKGQDRIRFWRKWIWFVFIAVPGFVLVNIVWPYLGVVR